MKPTILFLFNSSTYAVAPWLADGGYECVSIDYQSTDHSKAHRPLVEHPRHTRLNIDLSDSGAVETITECLNWHGLEQPSFILSFAPCTDLAVSGAAHFARKRSIDPLFQDKAVALCRLVEHWDCPSIVENPVSVLATMWKKPTGYVHPWQFSYLFDTLVGPHPEFPDVIPAYDWYNKKTGLWCQHGAAMPEIDWAAVKGPTSVNPGWAQLGGKSARTKYIRSLTPRGMAKAIYLANKDQIWATRGTQEALSHVILETNPQEQHSEN